MTDWLHAHGFRYKKPQGVPAKADKIQQSDFIESYKQLKAEAAKGREPIYFVDGFHPDYQSRLAYGWILEGDRKPVALTAKQPRLTIMGGICLTNHRVTYKSLKKIESSTVATFLELLRRKHSGRERLHIIWDNESYHKTEEVKTCAKRLNIELHYLPPYSPSLNPIERLWKLLHESVTYNKCYEIFNAFKESILTFFKTIGRKKIILRSRITDNFHILHSPLFAS
jgi:transposase